jgi:hypothetical protein
VSDKGKEKGDVTVAVPGAVNERIGAICKRTGMSKRRVVKVLLEFALPTYEIAANRQPLPHEPWWLPDDNSSSKKSLPPDAANPGPAPALTPPAVD